MSIEISKAEARRYILLKQGLLGKHKFNGEEGIFEYIKQAGSIQFDPIDVCGKNHELVLQSRVKDINRSMLHDLLYNKRRLIDHLDKCMCICLVEHWPYLSRIREAAKKSSRSMDKVDLVRKDIYKLIEERGPVNSSDVKLNQSVYWNWSDTTLGRAALESMYFQGELIIHHKNGSRKYYDFAHKYISNEILNGEDPNETQLQYHKWQILRRIGAVGMLWNKASDAWLGIEGLKTVGRNKAFAELLEEDMIVKIHIKDVMEPLYIKKEDLKNLNIVLSGEPLKSRTELIAPLDNMMWDRKLIKEIFNFHYKWEIYTPVPQRKYSYYVLPIIHGDSFVGRVEVLRDKSTKSLLLKNLWWEEGIKVTKTLEGQLDKCLKRFAKYITI